VREVAHEARVVDAADRPQSHGAGGELPEIRHQPGVRVAAQAPGASGRGGDLLPVVGQVSLGQPALQKGAGIDAGRAVRLKEHEVSTMRAARLHIAGVEEVVEAHLKQIGRAGIAGNVATQFAIGAAPKAKGSPSGGSEAWGPVFALATMASAFQRMSDASFSSMARSPGKGGCWSTAMVLT
jgi:hypothetical protein